jgi:hypothetical protein
MDPALHAAATSLFARYARGVDEGDIDDLADCFTVDARMELRLPGADPIVLDGRAAIAGFVRDFRASPEARQQRRHGFTGVLAEPDGAGRARASATLLLTGVVGDGVALLATGRYRDALVAEADGWRIAERVAVMDVAPRT